MDNKFIITIACRNVEDWAETNLESVLCQTYQNYEVIYINDASTDSTEEVYKRVVGDNPKFKYIKHDVRQYTCKIPVMEPITDPDIIWVDLDGDDWFASEDVLEKYNNFYNLHDCWLTYGKMLIWDGSGDVSEAGQQNQPYPDIVHKCNFYRHTDWRASHLRTYKNFLWRGWDKEDYKSVTTGKGFHHGGDLAIMFPMMEICPPGKALLVDFFSVVWNADPSKMDKTKERESGEKNEKFEDEIRFGKRRYKQVKSREEIKGEKIPTVIVVGGEDYENTEILTEGTFVYNVDPFLNWEYDAVILRDENIIPHIQNKPKFPKGKVIAHVSKSNIYNLDHEISLNLDLFDLVITCDQSVISNKNVEYCEPGPIKPNEFYLKYIKPIL